MLGTIKFKIHYNAKYVRFSLPVLNSRAGFEKDKTSLYFCLYIIILKTRSFASNHQPNAYKVLKADLFIFFGMKQ